MTQSAFAAAASAGKRTLIEWEKGATSPNAVQLSALSSIGVDVRFVVTGEREALVAEDLRYQYGRAAQTAKVAEADADSVGGEPGIHPPAPPTRADLARGTGLDPAWPMVMEIVVDALIDHGRHISSGHKLRELVDAVLRLLRLNEEGDLDNEKLRRKIEAMV